MNKKNILMEFEPEELKRYEFILGSICRHFGGLGDLNPLLGKIGAANDYQSVLKEWCTDEELEEFSNDEVNKNIVMEFVAEELKRYQDAFFVLCRHCELGDLNSLFGRIGGSLAAQAPELIDY